VGRGEYQSSCVLITPFRLSAAAKERIDVICQTNDGFKIGEKDLEIRGPGEILGTRQSGELEFKSADFTKDRQALRWAIEDRDWLNKTDPELNLPENRIFKARLVELYQRQWRLIDLS
jgi:ATP-dependent DNA helicase RecG